MKKTKKALATLALSATLAMGAVPAFAADATVNDTGSFDVTGETGKGSTQLNVQATASQIQATLPVSITVVTPADGGNITAPSDKAYKIVNNGEADLKIKSIQGVNANGWEIKSKVADKENAGEISGKGEMQLSVKAGESAPLVITTTDAAVTEPADAYFAIPASNSLGLTLTGATAVKTTLGTDSPIPAVKIQYTVGTK